MQFLNITAAKLVAIIYIVTRGVANELTDWVSKTDSNINT